MLLPSFLLCCHASSAPQHSPVRLSRLASRGRLCSSLKRRRHCWGCWAAAAAVLAAHACYPSSRCTASACLPPPPSLCLQPLAGAEEEEDQWDAARAPQRQEVKPWKGSELMVRWWPRQEGDSELGHEQVSLPAEAGGTAARRTPHVQARRSRKADPSRPGFPAAPQLWRCGCGAAEAAPINQRAKSSKRGVLQRVGG